jgi:transcriptional regulator with XRE-family HTH domain
MTKRHTVDARSALLHLLKELRNEAGLRQQDIAARIGQPQSFVSRYESGGRRLDIVELREVCEVCNVSLTEFSRRFERLLKEG